MDVSSVHVVVTCSHRKTRPVPAAHRLRAVTGAGINTRLKEWIRCLQESVEPTVPAVELYAGEHWSIAKRLCRADASGRVRLWVCSAGYGLIPADAPIRSYSATFAGPHPDRVPGGRRGAAAWWAGLADHPRPGNGNEPRCLAELAAVAAHVRLLLVLSAPYLGACRADVLAAAARLRPAGVSIISVGAGRPGGEVAGLMLPADARLQHHLGGTRSSLNVRIAEHLLTAGILDHAGMQDHLARLAAAQPPLTRYGRQPMSDGELHAFIRAHLQADPAANHTRLLRELRDGGRACEQSRFARLFRDVKQVRP